MAPLTVFALAFETATLAAAPSCAEHDYAEAVARYRSGDYPEGLSSFEALGRPMEPGAAETDDACIATLSLLDTELGAMHAAESRWTAARAYLEAAWQTGARIRDGRRRTRFQQHWLLYVGLVHQDLIFSGERAFAVSGAETYLTWAAERYPEDPEVFLAAGAFFERASSVGLRPSAREAEALYMDALRADPTLAAAHGRLGRVRSFRLVPTPSRAPRSRRTWASPPSLSLYIEPAWASAVWRNEADFGRTRPVNMKRRFRSRRAGSWGIPPSPTRSTGPGNGRVATPQQPARRQSSDGREASGDGRNRGAVGGLSGDSS